MEGNPPGDPMLTEVLALLRRHADAFHLFRLLWGLVGPTFAAPGWPTRQDLAGHGSWPKLARLLREELGPRGEGLLPLTEECASSIENVLRDGGTPDEIRDRTLALLLALDEVLGESLGKAWEGGGRIREMASRMADQRLAPLCPLQWSRSWTHGRSGFWTRPVPLRSPLPPKDELRSPPEGERPATSLAASLRNLVALPPEERPSRVAWRRAVSPIWEELARWYPLPRAERRPLRVVLVSLDFPPVPVPQLLCCYPMPGRMRIHYKFRESHALPSECHAETLERLAKLRAWLESEGGEPCSILAFPELTVPGTVLEELGRLHAEANAAEERPAILWSYAGSYHWPSGRGTSVRGLAPAVGPHGLRSGAEPAWQRAWFIQAKRQPFDFRPALGEDLGLDEDLSRKAGTDGLVEDLEEPEWGLEILDTPIGRFAHLICLDFLQDDILALVKRLRVDHLFVLSMDESADLERYEQTMADLRCFGTAVYQVNCVPVKGASPTDARRYRVYFPFSNLRCLYTAGGEVLVRGARGGAGRKLPKGPDCPFRLAEDPGALLVDLTWI
jgi:hypothetical protein